MQVRKMFVAVGLTAILLVAAGAMADVFGTGANQFTMDFVTISGSTNPSNPIVVKDYWGNPSYTFVGVANDYRMGTFDVTNDQWDKFTASLGVPVTGADGGYSSSSYYTGANLPVHFVSWFEAAQFVNWLNTSTGHQAAYKFTGTQGTANYALAIWSAAEAANNGTDLYRNKDAFYYLPTDDEWEKAAYWNGTKIQQYATKPGDTLYQGNGSNGGWNYGHYANPLGPWAVGSGSQELNGTYDMMGNVWQWTESPSHGYDYTGNSRGNGGGSYVDSNLYLGSFSRHTVNPWGEYANIGFRVSSEVPEPCTLGLFALGGLALLKRKRG